MASHVEIRTFLEDDLSRCSEILYSLPDWFGIERVIAVDPAFHRAGSGTQLIDWAETWCQARGARWLHVKTRGPSTPDPQYDRTRAFYRAYGFEPLFESLELWGPENAALIVVKHLNAAGGRGT
jgi:GNAT superfamily N-acetyltransferase